MDRKDLVQELLDMHRKTLDALAHNVRCPRCKQFFNAKLEGAFNLGPAYNSFEGCKACSEAIKKPLE